LPSESVFICVDLWFLYVIFTPKLGFRPCLRYWCGMTAVEKDILDALDDLEAKVKVMPTANPKPNLLPIFGRLDELTSQLPHDTDPTLLHYLHRKSYEKARLHLLGRDEENRRGTCGP